MVVNRSYIYLLLVFLFFGIFLFILFFSKASFNANKDDKKVLNFYSLKFQKELSFEGLDGWEFRPTLVTINSFESENGLKYLNVNFIDDLGGHKLNTYVSGRFSNEEKFFDEKMPVYTKGIFLNYENQGKESVFKKTDIPLTQFLIDYPIGSFLRVLVVTKYNKVDLENIDFCNNFKVLCDYIKVVESNGYIFSDINLVNVKDSNKFIIPLGIYEEI